MSHALAGTAYLEGTWLADWARAEAGRLLAGALPQRWAHSHGVARQAARVAHALPERDRPVLIAAAWLHDIGYAPAVAVTGFHQLDGACHLAARRVPPRVCALVAHHSGAEAVAELVGLADRLAEFPDERGPCRDALWYCDMTTGPDGSPVTFAERMRELRARRGPGDVVVQALRRNGLERAAAVHRTEHRLLTARTAASEEAGDDRARQAG